MNHSFNIDIATKFGMESAVILNLFEFWISKNKANDKHFHDGMYWTYNSRKALQEIFPYLTEWDIRTAIQKLCESGLVVVGNYNTSPMDKTSWYAITDYGFQVLNSPDVLHGKSSNNTIGETHQSNVRNSPIDLRNTQMDMRNSPMEGEKFTNLQSINNINNIYNSSIPVIDHSYNNNISASEDAQTERKETIEEHFEKLWELYPLKKGKGKVSVAKKKYLFNISLEEWKRAIGRYLEYVNNAGFDLHLMHGSTFCNSGHIDYLDKNYHLEAQEENEPESEEVKECEGPVDYGWGDD